MVGRPTWRFWVRGSLLCALGGLWVANGLLDEEQYTRAGLAYTWAASLPILVQTVVVLAIVCGVGAHARMREPPARRAALPRLLGLLALSQLALFLALEVSERVAPGRRKGRPFTFVPGHQQRIAHPRAGIWSRNGVPVDRVRPMLFWLRDRNGSMRAVAVTDGHVRLVLRPS
jgi:hypothetical protein